MKTKEQIEEKIEELENRDKIDKMGSGKISALKWVLKD